MPRENAEDEQRLVKIAHDIGFDTLIVHSPTPLVMEMAHRLGMRVCAIVTPNVTTEYARNYPDAVQRMLPAEDAIAEAVSKLDWEHYTAHAHRWFYPVQLSHLLCFESPQAQDELRARVSTALAVADGVAFDGFGFRNHYACYCPRCQTIRDEMAVQQSGRPSDHILAEMSEASLVNLSHLLYEHAKGVKADALVTNHIWPPFRPNPDYPCRLRLDYCSQTISWFYRPHWSLERVRFEAEQMKRLENPARNRFVPFIGLFDQPHLLRTLPRMAAEMPIALEYGAGSLVFCSLYSLWRHPEIRQIIQDALEMDTIERIEKGLI